MLTITALATSITVYVKDFNSAALIPNATVYVVYSSSTTYTKTSYTTNSSGYINIATAPNGNYGLFSFTSSCGIVNVPAIETVSTGSSNITKTIYLKNNSTNYVRSNFGKPFTSYTAPSILSGQNFGWRHMNNVVDAHNGMDIGGLAEGTEIYTICDGTVQDKGTTTGRGNYVKIQTPPYMLSYYISYQHMKYSSPLSTGANVSKASIVTSSTVVGEVGKSGATAVHLHIEASTSSAFASPGGLDSNTFDPNCLFG